MLPGLILLMAASFANLDAASQLPHAVPTAPAAGAFFDSPAAQTDDRAEELGVHRGKPSRLLRYLRFRPRAVRRVGLGAAKVRRGSGGHLRPAGKIGGTIAAVSLPRATSPVTVIAPLTVHSQAPVPRVRVITGPLGLAR